MQMFDTLEEQAWIARWRLLGDERAFARLVDKYKDMVLRFFLMQTGGRQDVSDDLAQQTFIRVWQRMSSLKEAHRFRAWLFRIAYNIWIDHCRMARLSQSPLSCAAECITSETADGMLEHSERHASLMAALDSLGAPERTAVVLYHLQEMSIREIASVMCLCECTVRSHLHRGRQKLRKVLTPND